MEQGPFIGPALAACRSRDEEWDQEAMGPGAMGWGLEVWKGWGVWGLGVGVEP